MAVYGNTVLREYSLNKTDNILESSLSVVYNEYLYHKSLLESCTDDSNRSILEAKIEVLYEVSVKDIISKIKELWKKFKDWIKTAINKVLEKIRSIRKRNNTKINNSTESKNENDTLEKEFSLNIVKVYDTVEDKYDEFGEGVDKFKKSLDDFLNHTDENVNDMFLYITDDKYDEDDIIEKILDKIKNKKLYIMDKTKKIIKFKISTKDKDGNLFYFKSKSKKELKEYVVSLNLRIMNLSLNFEEYINKIKRQIGYYNDKVEKLYIVNNQTKLNPNLMSSYLSFISVLTHSYESLIKYFSEYVSCLLTLSSQYELAYEKINNL